MPTIHHYSRTHRRRAVPSAMWSQPAHSHPQPAILAERALAIEETATVRIPSVMSRVPPREAEGPLWVPPAHQPDLLHVPSPLLPPLPDPAQSPESCPERSRRDSEGWPTLPQLASRIPEGLKATARYLWSSIAPTPRPPHPYFYTLRAQQETVA